MSHAAPSKAELLQAVSAALAETRSPLSGAPLQKLDDKGLAHDHIRIVGSGLLARVPKQSQMQLAAHDNLTYQRVCFERARASGHVPHLQGLLAPSVHLPRGALLVEEIVGRAVQLPQDVGLIVQALASIHTLPLPANEHRAPLINLADPLRALFDEVAEQARFLVPAGVSAQVQALLLAELTRLQQLCARAPRPERCLIAFDGHPGNYVIRATTGSQPQAILVDLEKCRYSYPSLDLAHATLYTSTTWDAEVNAVLTVRDIENAYKVWADSVGPEMAQAMQAWHLPLRRAMWLWSVTWCAKWRSLSGAAARDSGDGEDWSAQRSDAALIAHVRGRVDHYLSDEVVQGVLDELRQLEQVLG